MAEPKSPIVIRADDRDPWDRQPGESLNRWNQFALYRDLGRTRTLKRAAERLNITHRTAQQYAYTWRWNERCGAYDAHMDRQWLAALDENSRAMVREHLRLSKQVLGKVSAGMDGLDPSVLSATELTRMAELYSKLARVALGEPDTSVQLSGPGRGPITVTSVPADENTRRAQMESAAMELARRLGNGTLDAEDVLELTGEDDE
jgi:hypothetical protein